MPRYGRRQSPRSVAGSAASSRPRPILVVLACEATLGKAAFEAWGWRLPFLLSAVLMGVSIYMRLKLKESPVFLAMRSRAAVHSDRDRALGQWANLRIVLPVLFGAVAGQAGRDGDRLLPDPSADAEPEDRSVSPALHDPRLQHRPRRLHAGSGSTPSATCCPRATGPRSTRRRPVRSPSTPTGRCSTAARREPQNGSRMSTSCWP